ncbi:TetR family transcriptional regulator C-terminal domain-containing protein [Actinomadura luteofluorescens]|uniref:TetR/AcrR family transcriptional regulator n=1 Tax=Actinomadura luteofluorescens TaxID=46163 RepID=UPI002164A15C|nr:TetR/AcrR family transcriptional regulator [Actinomadura glauciflava]MCR3744317.1 transcriptional regulator, TetR family [Actinomadura glauciflava]
MPRRVDHDRRRAEFAEAVWRIAAEAGPAAVTMSAVAAEAGTSIGRIQHYFPGKDDLLAEAAAALRDRIDRHVREAIGRVPDPTNATATLHALLMALLPVDEERRATALVGAAFFHHTLRHPESSARHLQGHELIVSAVADALRGASLSDDDAEREARLLVALVQGLATQLLLGHITAEEADALVRHQLGRLQTTGAPSARGDHPPA